MTNRDQTRALIQTYYDAFNAGDIEAMVDLVTEDVIHDVNQGERRIGRSRFHAFCARMAHHYDETVSDLQILVSDDSTRAAAEFNVAGLYKEMEPGLPTATGQKYALPAGAFFVVRRGLIGRVTTYYNLTDWIMQVGNGLLPEVEE
jgi:steroid delta-isomerase-like uncharacterized protein